MGPRIGDEPITAMYEFIVCGERRAPSPMWEGTGVHTHGNGDIHIHPLNAHEEGPGSRLTMWFFYGGGILTGDQIRLPGYEETYKTEILVQMGLPAKCRSWLTGRHSRTGRPTYQPKGIRYASSLDLTKRLPPDERASRATMQIDPLLARLLS